MLFALVLWPLLLAGIAFAALDKRRRPWLLPVAGTGQLALTLHALARPPAPALGGWLVLDPLGGWFLLLASVLLFAAGWYGPPYLRVRPEQPNRVFIGSLLVFAAMTTLICLSHHLGLLWVALEATTLASAPLIYFNRSAPALEATWKYLLVGSVGVALALMGSLFLAYSAVAGGAQPSLLLPDLLRDGRLLSRPWLHAAFVLLLVGYGTKLGLAPLHGWKPDAYGEAPGMVGMLLAGSLTGVAFLALLRFYQVCVAAGESAFAREILGAVGLFSVAVAAAFLARQRDYKRMIAWSSVEHVGLLALGIGLGGSGVRGSLLHAFANGLGKGVLFLAAANIHRAEGSKLIADTRGVLSRRPGSGGLLVAGMLAATGSPPFGTFWSELLIVNAAIVGGRYLLAAILLLLLVVVFLGMGASVIEIAQGAASAPAGGAGAAPRSREAPGLVWPGLALLSLLILLGVYAPGPLWSLLEQAAALIEGKP